MPLAVAKIPVPPMTFQVPESVVAHPLTRALNDSSSVSPLPQSMILVPSNTVFGPDVVTVVGPVMTVTVLQPGTVPATNVPVVTGMVSAIVKSTAVGAAAIPGAATTIPSATAAPRMAVRLVARLPLAPMTSPKRVGPDFTPGATADRSLGEVVEASQTRPVWCDNRWVVAPELQFADTADGVRIAYQRVGAGPTTIVVAEELNHVVVLWEMPAHARAFEYMAEHLDLVLYDQRGSGNSDRIEASTLADRLLDLDALIDATEAERVNLVGRGSGAIVAAAYAASRPQLVDRVVISNGRVPMGHEDRVWDLAPDSPVTRERHRELVESAVANWGVDAGTLVSLINPRLADDPSVVAWWTRYQRTVVSRGEVIREGQDVNRWAPAVAELQFGQPVLITHTRGDRANIVGHARLWSEWLPQASIEVFGGDDHEIYLTRNWESILSRHVAFLTDAAVEARVLRRYAAVLFTDIAGSTSSSLEHGDDAWGSLLDTHDRLSRSVVSEASGRLVKLTGDGVLATFESPADAIDAAARLRSALAGVGLTIRAGIHAGLIELRGDDVSGSVVNLAARTMQAAPDAEIYVTASLRDQLLGSGVDFEPAGSHELKGFDVPRELFRVGNST